MIWARLPVIEVHTTEFLLFDLTPRTWEPLDRHRGLAPTYEQIFPED